MENNTNKKNRGVVWGLIASLVIVAIVVFVTMIQARGNGEAGNGAGTTTTVAAIATPASVVSVAPAVNESVCDPGIVVKFFAYDTPDAAFGPAVDPNTETVLQELHNRRCADPALVVSHEMYQTGDYLTEAGRDERIAYLADNRVAHDEAVAALELHEAEAVSVTIEHINVENQSMWMLDTQPRPTIVAGPSDVREFDALVFTYADGTREVHKLDCGFQPMSPSFPELPPIPPDEVPPPQTTVVTTPPTVPTTPPTTEPEETTTTTRPTTPTVPTTPPTTEPEETTTTTRPTTPTTVPQFTTTTKAPYDTQPPSNSTITPTVPNRPATPPPTAPPQTTPRPATTHVQLPPDDPDSGAGASAPTLAPPPVTTAPPAQATLPPYEGTTGRPD